MKSTIFALGLMIAIVAAGVANAQGLTAVNAINASWRSHTGSVTPVSLSSGTTTLDAEGNGVFTISFTATATDQDTSGAYITPTPSFICRVEQGSYGLAEYIGEDGGSMFFANFWHAPAENITITGFDPNDGSTKFQVEIPIDGQMNHFTLMRSDSEVQSFDFWCADAASLGSAFTSAPPVPATEDFDFIAPIAPIQIFSAVSPASSGAQNGSRVEFTVALGTASTSDRTVTLALEVPGLTPAEIAGRASINPTSVLIPAGETLGHFDVVIEDDGTLFQDVRIVDVQATLGGDVSSYALPVSDYVVDFGAATSSSSATFWRKKCSGKTRGSTSADKPNARCGRCHALMPGPGGVGVAPPPPAPAWMIGTAGGSKLVWWNYWCSKAFRETCLVFNDRFTVAKFVLGAAEIRDCRAWRHYIGAGISRIIRVPGTQWCRDYTYDSSIVKVLPTCTP